MLHIHSHSGVSSRALREKNCTFCLLLRSSAVADIVLPLLYAACSRCLVFRLSQYSRKHMHLQVNEKKLYLLWWLSLFVCLLLCVCFVFYCASVYALMGLNGFGASSSFPANRSARIPRASTAMAYAMRIVHTRKSAGCMWRCDVFHVNAGLGLVWFCWSHKLIALFNQPPMRFSFVKCATLHLPSQCVCVCVCLCWMCTRVMLQWPKMATTPANKNAHFSCVPASSYCIIEIGYEWVEFGTMSLDEFALNEDHKCETVMAAHHKDIHLPLDCLQHTQCP